ncbi:hypothetical protein [Pseudoalteromonas sp. DL-6]|uniref:hypothetical protein n=1 Tax=Pseudoalteromonas sp. DL-6 TaxID=1390185 RepID=UPI001040B1AD|nr:hypothetical protein [Pseudoalteromonas sp. DL-6]QBJ61631.1 hypothetical protein B1F84_00585 [Pseudoalteromonas sp. DL-6]|tara:strand:- start:862 stop:1704 length:843 start_codon:yes stop_codon:yes gene_type:complete
MRKYIIALPIILSGCISSNPIKPEDLSHNYFDTGRRVGYKIQSQNLEYDIKVAAQCDSNKQKYSFSFIDKSSGQRAYQPQWSFFFNGEKDYRSSKEYDEAEYLNKATNVQVARYLGSSKYSQKVDLSAPELLNLPTLCKDKYTQIQKDSAKRRKQRMEKDAELVASVKKSTGLEPMFSDSNQKNFNELVYSFQTNGFAQHQNKFVWTEDGDYKVSQVLDGKLMLTSYSTRLPPITIITNLPAIEGQFWSSISRAPLKFVGVTNYTTVLGATKQTVVFQQL